MGKAYFYKLGAEGTAWTLSSLGSGLALSKSTQREVNLSKGGTLVALTSRELESAANSHRPLEQAASNKRVIRMTGPARLLLDKLRQLENEAAPLVVVVEDDLARRGDPALERNRTGKVFYFDDKPIHIKMIRDFQNPDNLVAHLSQASGYPLNAFVLPLSSLPNGPQLGGSDIEQMSSSVLAVINSAFDCETYTIWEPSN